MCIHFGTECGINSTFLGEKCKDHVHIHFERQAVVTQTPREAFQSVRRVALSFFRSSEDEEGTLNPFEVPVFRGRQYKKKGL